MSNEEALQYIRTANEIYSEEGRIEIDIPNLEKASENVSVSEKGVYVKAWVWVGEDDVP